VAVFGPCGARREDLSRLAEQGVPDDVAWRWPGSYVTVEITSSTVSIWTDLGGACPIYVTGLDGGTYWASSSRALAGLTCAEVNLNRLSAAVLAASAPAVVDGLSAFDGIELVPAGHRCSIPTDGRSPRLRKVWAPRPRPGSGPVQLRHELDMAVKVRLERTESPSTDLSGGYDSTALALLAAQQLAPQRTITAVTVHPAGRRHGGDLSYARGVAEHPGLAHRLMPLGEEHAPYSAMHEVPVTDEPAPSTIAHARFSGQMRWIHEKFGTDCHFTGDGGDSLLCSPPIVIADLLAARRHWRAFRETVAWARLRRLPVRPLLSAARHTRRSRRDDSLRALTTSWKRRHSRPDGHICWYDTEPAPSWATPQALDRTATLIQRAADRLEQPDATAFAATIAAENMAEVGRTARADAQIAEYNNVPLHNPFTDSRVVDAYLSVPVHERPGPAQYKPMLAAALSDLFPQELRERTTKGDFNPDHYGGMRTNLSTLHALADGHLAEYGLVDPVQLRRTLTMTSAGLPVAFSSIEPVIAAEVWLRTLQRSAPIAWVCAGQEST